MDENVTTSIVSVIISGIIPSIDVIPANIKIKLMTILTGSVDLNLLVSNRIYFYYPGINLTLPCITYFEINKDADLYADDTEYGLKDYFQIDIWTNSIDTVIYNILKSVMINNDFVCIESVNQYDNNTNAYRRKLKFITELTGET